MKANQLCKIIIVLKCICMIVEKAEVVESRKICMNHFHISSNFPLKNKVSRPIYIYSIFLILIKFDFRN